MFRLRPTTPLVHKKRVDSIPVFARRLHNRPSGGLLLDQLGAALDQHLPNEALEDNSRIGHAQAERVHADVAEHAPHVELDSVLDGGAQK